MENDEKLAKTAKTGVKQIALNRMTKTVDDAPRNPYEPYQPLNGVLPKGTVAQDAVLDNSASAYAYGAYQGASFVGYPYLAQLSTITEYRNPSDIIASEMTRKWITLNSSGEGDFSEQIKAINDELERFKIRNLFYQAALTDGLFGISFINISMKGENVKLPLVISDKTIQKNSIKAFSLVEPIWCSPLRYNAINPLKPDFYKPTAWAVMGMEVHASRLLKFISRPMPDILKPAFNFGGMSLTQLLMPFVNSWISTRDSIGDLIRIFSISVLKTDMSQVLSGGDGSDIVNRAKMFNQTRDSRGLMMLNTDTEDLMQVNTPLSGLGDLQAQSEEQMAFPAQIPLVKLFGISPHGLNASSEGEIKIFYDHIHDMQEKLFRPNLTHVLQLVQLNLFGKIIPEIGFTFEHLDDVAPDVQATINKTRADTDNVYVQMGVISQEEVRANLANDVTSGYENLDADDMPEPPEPPEPPEGESPKKPSDTKK